MFTGIVQTQLEVTAITPGQAWQVELALPNWGALEIGESILLHGICSTVTTIADQSFTVEFMPETLHRTNVEAWKVGDQIHAEPSATLQTKLSGNLVYGHVDATAAVVGVEPQVGQTALSVKLPTEYTPYLVVKGAITINGANLTIVQVAGSVVTVDLIPHTISVTSLAKLKIGDTVNIECDYVTKVIVQTAQQRS